MIERRRMDEGPLVDPTKGIRNGAARRFAGSGLQPNRSGIHQRRMDSTSRLGSACVARSMIPYESDAETPRMIRGANIPVGTARL